MKKQKVLLISRILLACGLLFGVSAASRSVVFGNSVAPGCVGGGSY